MVRAKELFTWTPSFESIKEHDYSSEDESVQGVGSKENKYNTYEKEEGEFNNSEDEEVAETDFMEKSSQSMEHSVHVDKEISADPFGLNDLLGLKKPVEENLEPSPSLSHPPGFSPVGSLNSSDKELNKEFSPTISAKVMNNSQVVHEDVSFNSVGGSGNNKGGSVLGVLDEMIRVGRAMGYSMEGCEKDIESIINSKGDEAAQESVTVSDSFVAVRGTWISLSLKLNVYFSFCASRLSLKEIFVGLSLKLMIIFWDGECIILGDFNEVRSENERFGTIFNDIGAKAFNHFISSSCLIDLPLEGYSFTWALKSSSKMSKLDRFLISEGLISIFSSLAAICLDRRLSDHRPILLRESFVDYGPTLFRVFHSWFPKDGFDNLIADTWNNLSIIETNRISLLRKKFQALKAIIKN
ncbi:RNA-directed DNA polymerase, eukaryota [Tanacetum coccineum]